MIKSEGAQGREEAGREKKERNKTFVNKKEERSKREGRGIGKQ